HQIHAIWQMTDFGCPIVAGFGKTNRTFSSQYIIHLGLCGRIADGHRFLCRIWKYRQFLRFGVNQSYSGIGNGDARIGHAASSAVAGEAHLVLAVGSVIVGYVSALPRTAITKIPGVIVYARSSCGKGESVSD